MMKRVLERSRPEYLVYLARRPELRRAMAGPNIKPGELARLLGLRRSTVYGVLQGRESSKRVATAICEYFNRPIEELFMVIDLEDQENSPDRARHPVSAASG